jgi:hypothetical protein
LKSADLWPKSFFRRLSASALPPLEHCGGHAADQEGKFFFAERIKEPTERTDARFRRHRSSGVAARYRAQRTFSSSAIPLVRARLRNAAAIFFEKPNVTARNARRRTEFTENASGE